MPSILSLLKLGVRWFLKFTGDLIVVSVAMAIRDEGEISNEKPSREGSGYGLAIVAVVE